MQQIEDRLRQLLAAFFNNSGPARTAIRELLLDAPGAFCAAALPILKDSADTPGRQYIIEMMLAHGVLPLCDPSLLSLEEEVGMARDLAAADPFLDTKMARRIVKLAGAGEEEIDVPAAERMLEVLAAISDGSRVRPMVVQLLRHPNARLRSKAALLVGRSSKNPHSAEGLMAEPDARVRANSIEGLWGADSPAVRSVFWEATADANNRVVGNALLGLYRLGETAAIRPILEMALHPQPPFRSTAAWVMGQSGDPRFLPALARMVRETDRTVRRNVFLAISRIKRVVRNAGNAPRLRAYICQLKEQPDGGRLIRTAVAAEDSGEVPGLRPTRMVLSDAGRMIAEYSVQRYMPPDLLVLGLALPASPTRSEPLDHAVTQAVDACLAVKRAWDRWVIVRYACALPEGAANGAGALSAPCLLATDAETLRRDCENPALTRPNCGGAVQSLLGGMAACASGRRSLLLVAAAGPGWAPDDHEREHFEGLVKQARFGAVAIHAVALGPPAHPLAALAAEACETTGGMFVLAGGPERLPALLQRLYFGLLHRYDILYQAGPGAPGARREIRLRVYAENAFGEDAIEA